MSIFSSTLVSAACIGVAAATPEVVVGASDAFEKFKADFGKTYDIDEHDDRLENFAANLDFISQENSKNGGTYKIGVNSLADLSLGQYRQRLGYKTDEANNDSRTSLGEHLASPLAELADTVDWRGKAVAEVKDQGQCGSCWAFSTTGALEGAWAVATGTMVDLSEQQLVDCSKKYNHGCHGGLMDAGFLYEESHVVCTEQSYPYNAAEGTCKQACTEGLAAGAVVGFMDVKKQSMASMMSALSQQPVSIAIDAASHNFMLYTSGVFNDCGTQLDHGVLAVGYGSEDGSKYWVVKNSWGPNWGDHGFIKLARGDADGAGTCGILLSASYPVVKSTQQMISV